MKINRNSPRHRSHAVALLLPLILLPLACSGNGEASHEEGRADEHADEHGDESDDHENELVELTDAQIQEAGILGYLGDVR